MISESYIKNLVDKWAASPEGKAKIKKETGMDYDPKFGTTQAKAYGRQMQQILFAYINPIIKSISINDIVVGEPTVGKDSLMRIQISFRDGSLHRKSLNPRSDGLNNIVLLFTKGYHASKRIRGIWTTSKGDIEVWSRQSREPNDFLQRAISDFNTSANGVAVAELENEYKNNNG